MERDNFKQEAENWKKEAEIREQRMIKEHEALKKEAQLKKLFELEHKIHTSVNSKNGFLKIAELDDFNLHSAEFVAKGQLGAVFKININWNKMGMRVDVPKDSPGLSQVALKKLYSFYSDKTLDQKNAFDQEFAVPFLFPHWSLMKVFNYFRGPVVDTLLAKADVDRSVQMVRTTYFTMELADGKLESFLNANRMSVSVQECILIHFQLACGIDFLCQHNYVHLDIKPDNILMVSREKIQGNLFVLGDLGAAKRSPIYFHNLATLAGNQINKSPEFMQLLGDEEDESVIDISKNDIWASACILFQMIEKKHPFLDPEDQSLLNHNICVAALPNISGNIYFVNKFCQLMWERNHKKRMNSGLCKTISGLLVWGHPALTPNLFERFADAEKLHSVKNMLKAISLEACEGWLNEQRNEFFASYYENGNFASELVLKLHFLVHSSVEQLFEAIQLLSVD